MESVLKELFFKGCGTKNNSKKASDEELELVNLLEKNQEKLKVMLSDEALICLEKLTTCYDELSLLSEGQAFISGFRLGARIVMEVFFGEENFALIE